MKVSIIMPTYNRAYILEKAIKSVLAQSYEDWELIIVDDGSKDNTEEVVSRYVGEKVRYISYPVNRGGNHARNVGIRLAQGEYLAFLDSDNEWIPEALELSVKMLDSMEGKYKLITAITEFHSFDGSVDIRPNESECSLMQREALIKNIVCFDAPIADMNTYVFSRKCIERVGDFDEEQKKGQDWELLIRLLADEQIQYRFLKRKIAVNYIQENSISRQQQLGPTSMFRFLEKHIKICDAYGCLEEAFHKFLSTQFDMIPEVQSLRLFSLVPEQKRAELLKRFLEERCEGIKSSISNYNGMVFFQGLVEKDDLIMSVQSDWIRLYRSGENVASCLKRRGMFSVAIYGYGILGKQLYDELLVSDIEVKYLIDQSVERLKNDNVRATCITNRSENIQAMEKVDAVIVTAVFYYEEIKEKLCRYTDAEIISLEELVKTDLTCK